MQKLKKGDTVKIMSGKDRGQTGKVDKVLPKKQKLIVAGKNIYKKHVKPQGQDKTGGGIIEKSRPFHFAKVALLCPKCNKITRVGFKVTGGGKTTDKNRVCLKCKQII